MVNDALEVKEETIDIEDLIISSKEKEYQPCSGLQEDNFVKPKSSICDYIFTSKTDVDLDYLDYIIVDENLNRSHQSEIKCQRCSTQFYDLDSLNSHVSICQIHDNLYQKNGHKNIEKSPISQLQTPHFLVKPLFSEPIINTLSKKDHEKTKLCKCSMCNSMTTLVDHNFAHLTQYSLLLMNMA